jgi:peroxiredoxin Q/BCP
LLLCHGSYLIDPEGLLVERWLNVNPSRHSQEVLAFLDKIGVAKA